MSHVRAMVDVNAMGPTQTLSRNALATKNILVIIANLPQRISIKRFMIALELLTKYKDVGEADDDARPELPPDSTRDASAHPHEHFSLHKPAVWQHGKPAVPKASESAAQPASPPALLAR